MGKEMTPLVSVIIPVYNVRPFLERSLNSVIQQSYKNIEIIIIDDGSQDGSLDLIMSIINQADRQIVLKKPKIWEYPMLEILEFQRRKGNI